MAVDQTESRIKEPWVWTNSPFVGMSPWAFYCLSLFAFGIGVFLAAMAFFGFGWSEDHRSAPLAVGVFLFFAAFGVLFLIGGIKKWRWVAAYRAACGVKPWPLWGRKLWLAPFLAWTTAVFVIWVMVVHQRVDFETHAIWPRSRGVDFIFENPIPSALSLAGLALLVWIFHRKTKNNLQWEKDHNPRYPFI